MAMSTPGMTHVCQPFLVCAGTATGKGYSCLIEAVGVAKKESMADVALLEYHLRQDLNQSSPRDGGLIH